MTKYLKNSLFIILGWLCVALGIIGIILPVMPGTVFLITALFFFAKSSPRFHQMLLGNRWVGSELREWEEKKSITLKTFKKALSVIVISITASIFILYEHIYLQLLMASIGASLVFYLWKLTKNTENLKSFE